MKIAITGGAGFIGSHLTKAYLDAGHDVLILDNLLHGVHHTIDGRARFYPVDIRDHTFATILQKERPDIVSHHVARYSDELIGEGTMADADVHIRGLLHVLDSCVQASIKKFIFASGSYSLYGAVDAGRLPLQEDEPLRPQNAHDISKVAGEWYVRYYTRHYGLPHTILRYSDVYGSIEDNHTRHPLTYFATMLLQQKRPIIRGTGNEIRDCIFVDDVVQANLAALQYGENCTLHISSGQGFSLNQLYEMVATLLKRTISPLYTRGALLDIPAIVLDNSRASRVLRWLPQFPLPQGIYRAIPHAQESETFPQEPSLSSMAALMRV